MPARQVAKLIGVRTKTLAAWRSRGKGPIGWFHVSKIWVVYPVSAVEEFIAKSRNA